jgi:predicted phage baseplate assembly protein
MLAALTNADRPGLAKLGTRDDDDFTIGLLDTWAVVCDILAFYTERLAQESYLRTAQERISLQELGKLIGFQLDPGVAAQTYIAFALEPPPAVPPAASRDPGSAPPVTPASVTLEPGLRVQSIPGPGETPQTFETVEEVAARPGWNAFVASQTKPHSFALGDTFAYFAGTTLNLRPGDAILLAGPDIVDEQWDVRTATAVTVGANGTTRVDWTPGLGSASPHVDPASAPTAYVLRKRLDVFGHAAPQWQAMSPDFRSHYPGASPDPGDWPSYTVSAATGTAVDLEGSHPDVVAGSWVVLSLPNYRELWQVETVQELSRADFAVSGKVTRITLVSGENYALFQNHPREVTVFAVSEPLTLAEEPDPSAVTGGSLDVDADVSAMKPGRTLIVKGTTTAGEDHLETVVLEAVAPDGGKWRLSLQHDLSTSYERSSVLLYGNVALATHGETVRQLLGSGRASTPFQRFGLSHSPLTYVQSSSAPSGAADTLEVRVDGVAWTEAATLYGTGSRDRAFALRADETGASTLLFGDGARGSRLPTGVNNVQATYRTGLGAAGNVGAGKLAQLLDRPLGVKGVSNPSPATGGVDPQGEQSARASIPLGVRTLGRAVSLLDYADFALAFSGVAKADATVLPLRTGRTVVITVAFTGGDRIDDLTTALKTFGDPTVEILVLAGSVETFRIALEVAVDPAYERDKVLAGVEAALRAGYRFDARGFGEPVFLSRIDAAAQAVAGVVAIDVNRLYTAAPPSLSQRLLAQRPSVAADGSAIAAGLLVLDSAPFDWLQPMKT